MERRQFLKYGAAGATAALLPKVALAQTGSTPELRLVIEPVDAELIDGTTVYMVVFMQDSHSGDSRPVLRVREGDTVTVIVRNRDDRAAHGFSIRGVPAATIASIAPDGEASVTFTAPPGGTYLYLDPLNAPINRLLGLHGAFIVAPRTGVVPDTGAPIPYSYAQQTPEARALFSALGTKRFPGKRWLPTDPARDKLWLFHQIDPALHAALDAGHSVDPASIAGRFRPRYFTINGWSGFDLHANHDAMPSGYVGEPCLIRTLNAGLATHSPHIHGNHIYEVARSAPNGQPVVLDNICARDSWTLPPLAQVDVLLPFERPPDIPAARWPPSQEPFPMRYPMHCHVEMSQTAGGGNYPQGAVLHWELKGPLR